MSVVESGRITRSTDECEISRSCHKAIFSNAACAFDRTSLANPQICSHVTGFRLCGIADDPFCPAPNGGSFNASSALRVIW